MEAEVRHILRRKLERDRGLGYPDSMAAHPGENWVEHLLRITRPGFDLELPPRQIEDRPSPFE